MMRVAHSTLYNTNMLRLGDLTSRLSLANEVVSTGKQINKLSDDPTGLNQVLNIKANLANLEQLKRNISEGRTWLNSAETALATTKELVTDTKVLALAMDNDSVSSADRAEAAVTVRGTLEHLVMLANSDLNGRYIFAGTRIDTVPFQLDTTVNPPTVTYHGNDSEFAVKSGRNTTVGVGHDGEKIFWEDTLEVDATNNRIDFSEDGGTTQLVATIQNGTYTADALAAEVERALEAASGVGRDFTVTYDANTRQYAITNDDAGNLQMLWNSGANTGTSIAPDLGFDPTADDAVGGPYTSDREARWGIFQTLIDLEGYLQTDDRNGINRSLSRLDANLNHMIAGVSSIGEKESRLDVKEQIIEDLILSYEEKRSKIEDADIIEAVSKLQAAEMAYQAALASTARILRLSLVDYM